MRYRLYEAPAEGWRPQLRSPLRTTNEWMVCRAENNHHVFASVVFRCDHRGVTVGIHRSLWVGRFLKLRYSADCSGDSIDFRTNGDLHQLTASGHNGLN